METHTDVLEGSAGLSGDGKCSVAQQLFFRELRAIILFAVVISDVWSVCIEPRDQGFSSITCFRLPANNFFFFLSLATTMKVSLSFSTESGRRTPNPSVVRLRDRSTWSCLASMSSSSRKVMPIVKKVKRNPRNKRQKLRELFQFRGNLATSRAERV